MHELPPMQHGVRHSVLDVHHAILPETAHVRPDSALLLAGARVVPAHAAWRVLAPADMILHSMTHLFHSAEPSHGLRDLSDLDLMLRHEARDLTFWPRLQQRAEALHLTRTLHYGLQTTQRLLETPVPAEALDAAARFAAARAVDTTMRRLWEAALRTPHSSARLALTPAAQFILFVRAHVADTATAPLGCEGMAEACAARGWRLSQDPVPSAGGACRIAESSRLARAAGAGEQAQ